MAIRQSRIGASLWWRLPFASPAAPEEVWEPVLRRAAEQDTLSRAPAGLADRIVASALADPGGKRGDAFSHSDFMNVVMRPRMIGASFASFAAGVAAAIYVADTQAAVFVQSVMWGVAHAVTVGGHL